MDHTSIDHYIPKVANPTLAYEWSNFRLSRARLNNRKDNFQDVVDPYAVLTGEFRLDFGTFFIGPDPALGAVRQAEIRQSVTRLQLNTDDAYVNERARAVYTYADGQLPLADVTRFYPFIALELVAQNFNANFLPAYQTVLASPKARAALVKQGVL